jgi:hypothetical protein
VATSAPSSLASVPCRHPLPAVAPRLVACGLVRGPPSSSTTTMPRSEELASPSSDMDFVAAGLVGHWARPAVCCGGRDGSCRRQDSRLGRFAEVDQVEHPRHYWAGGDLQIDTESYAALVAFEQAVHAGELAGPLLEPNDTKTVPPFVPIVLDPCERARKPFRLARRLTQSRDGRLEPSLPSRKHRRSGHPSRTWPRLRFVRIGLPDPSLRILNGSPCGNLCEVRNRTCNALEVSAAPVDEHVGNT